MRGYFTSRKFASNLGVLAFLGIWFVTLAPTSIGGPAAYIEVSGHSMDGTYLTGDLVVTRQQDTYQAGDIVAFHASGGQVIHRIIGGDGTKGYTLQGDNNPNADPWHPTDSDVVGKAWIHMPQKAWVLHLPRNPMFAGITAGLLTLLVLMWDEWPSKSRRDEDASDEQDDLATDDVAATMPGQRSPAHESPALPRAR
jgi:signal peptidase I